MAYLDRCGEKNMGCRMPGSTLRQPVGCVLRIHINRYLAFRVTVNELFAGLVSVPLKLAVPVVASEPG